ncbi:hypothetical protein HDU98_012364, partial [Podochytrium sp. JEL0797]
MKSKKESATTAPLTTATATTAPTITAPVTIAPAMTTPATTATTTIAQPQFASQTKSFPTRPPPATDTSDANSSLFPAPPLLASQANDEIEMEHADSLSESVLPSTAIDGDLVTKFELLKVVAEKKRAEYDKVKSELDFSNERVNDFMEVFGDKVKRKRAQNAHRIAVGHLLLKML